MKRDGRFFYRAFRPGYKTVVRKANFYHFYQFFVVNSH